MTLQQMTEQIADWRSGEFVVDQTERTVRNVALVGRESRNGYRYSHEALTAAVGLYEHKPVFLDHAERLTKPYERSTRDLVGSIVHVRLEQNRIRGDIQVLDTEAGRTFLALAEARHAPIGMSHVVLAQRSSDRSQVERIEEVVSVDAVMYPATTRTFRESFQRTETLPGSFEDLTERIAESLPECLVRLGDDCASLTAIAVYPGCVILSDATTAELKQLRWRIDGEQIVFADTVEAADRGLLSLQLWESSGSIDVDGLVAERDRVISELERLQSEIAMREERDARELEVERLLREQRLPESEITNSLRERLLSTADAQARLAIVREHRELVEKLRQRPVNSHIRTSSVSTGISDRDIVETIRGRSPGHRLV